MEAAPGKSLPGNDLVTGDLASTALLVATSAAAAAAPDTFGTVHAVVSCLAFVVGCAAFLWAYAIGVSRSRAELVTMGGLFFLTGGVAPTPVATRLRLALVVQVVAVVAAAAIRPYSNVAFGVLAPLLGLGLMALWGARHGTFEPRPDVGSDPTDGLPADRDVL
jgi:hypothetical protein